MTNQDYSKSLVTEATANRVYEALTNEIKNWWSGDLSVEGDEFTIGFGETKKSFQAEISPPTNSGFEIVWRCTQANLLHPNVQTPDEWVGTHITWVVEANETCTKITMTHVGLNASLECFEICVGGWDFFFLDSLREYLATGQGKPFSASQEG